jgi:anti-sigma B factor antagonist
MELKTMELSVATRELEGWSVVDVAGEVDVFSAPKLREAIIGLLGDGKVRIIVNLEAVTFMDSTGLGVLVGALKRVKEQSGELAIAAAQGTVLRVLNVTGLNAVFRMLASVGDATSA